MWLKRTSAPDPPREHTWLLHAHPATQQRPNLWRRFTAPPAPEEPRSHLDVFDWHQRQPVVRHVPVSRRIGNAVHEAEEEVQAGCFRLLMRIVAWYAWRKWRAIHK